MYIIMALQEEGSETRISDFDPTSRGFPTEKEAYCKLDEAHDRYPEYRRIWVEELKDAEYWMMRCMSDEDEYGNDFETYGEF